jgi:hypothetical protein
VALTLALLAGFAAAAFAKAAGPSRGGEPPERP